MSVLNSKLVKNPLVSILESIEQIGVMATRLESSNKGKGKRGDTDILRQIKAMKESLSNNDMVDLICTLNIAETSEIIKAVLPVHLDFFFGRNMSEIIDGNYTVMGKVVKIVRDDSESINLFRNTGFKLFKQKAMEEMISSFNDSEDDQIELPDITSRISKPALLVIPIAIYS